MRLAWVCRSHLDIYFWSFGLNFGTISNAMCIPLRLVVACFSLCFALQSNASPTTPRNQGSLVTVNPSLNAVNTHCYIPDDNPGLEPAVLESCKGALAILVSTPDFAKRVAFTKNPTVVARLLPLAWQMAGCRIVFSCLNDDDSAVFRLADVAQTAKRIIDNCIDQPDPSGRFPLLKWGGVALIGRSKTFFANVGKPIRHLLEIGGGNMTEIGGGGLIEGGMDSL